MFKIPTAKDAVNQDRNRQVIFVPNGRKYTDKNEYKVLLYKLSNKENLVDIINFDKRTLNYNGINIEYVYIHVFDTLVIIRNFMNLFIALRPFLEHYNKIDLFPSEYIFHVIDDEGQYDLDDFIIKDKENVSFFSYINYNWIPYYNESSEDEDKNDSVKLMESASISIILERLRRFKDLLYRKDVPEDDEIEVFINNLGRERMRESLSKLFYIIENPNYIQSIDRYESSMEVYNELRKKFPSY
ncbi:MAG TPA: hypothetical protein PLQ59_07250 [Fervidobacterium sp.]|nr:hypothetical protein [Fervidobacterium sp.]